MPFLDDNSKRKSYIIIKVAFYEQVLHFLRTLIFKPYIFDRLRDKSSFRSAKMNMSKKVCQVENIHFGATIWWPISQPVKGIYRVQPVKGITLKDLGPREMCDWFIIMWLLLCQLWRLLYELSSKKGLKCAQKWIYSFWCSLIMPATSISYPTTKIIKYKGKIRL